MNAHAHGLPGHHPNPAQSHHPSSAQMHQMESQMLMQFQHQQMMNRKSKFGDDFCQSFISTIKSPEVTFYS